MEKKGSIFYVRLLSYDEACNVVRYANSIGCESNIVVYGIRVWVPSPVEKSLVEDFMRENVGRYAIEDERPTSVVSSIVANLKNSGKIL